MDKSVEAQQRMREILDWVEAHRRLLAEHPHLDAHLGKLDHQIARLALCVSEQERILLRAVTESKPE